MFDAIDDRVDQLLSRAARHSLGQVLVIQLAKRLPPAAAIKQLALERALAHLLEQRAEEGLADENLRVLHELVVPGRKLVGRSCQSIDIHMRLRRLRLTGYQP